MKIFLFPIFRFFSRWRMVYEGAKGQTAQEIGGVFHFPEDIMQMEIAINNALRASIIIQVPIH